MEGNDDEELDRHPVVEIIATKTKKFERDVANFKVKLICGSR